MTDPRRPPKLYRISRVDSCIPAELMRLLGAEPHAHLQGETLIMETSRPQAVARLDAAGFSNRLRDVKVAHGNDARQLAELGLIANGDVVVYRNSVNNNMILRIRPVGTGDIAAGFTVDHIGTWSYERRSADQPYGLHVRGADGVLLEPAGDPA